MPVIGYVIICMGDFDEPDGVSTTALHLISTLEEARTEIIRIETSPHLRCFEPHIIASVHSNIDDKE